MRPFPGRYHRITLPVMKYRRLGKSNLRVSVIGLGTWQFGGEWGKNFVQPEVDQILAAAREVGINFIDTAECYGDHTSEAFIGNAIAAGRDNWIVATKFGHKFHGHLSRTDERGPADALQQVEGSLKALKTDYIDLLQYHSIRDNEFDNDDLTAALESLLKSGKVRHLGNSLASALDGSFQAAESTCRHVEALQVVYNRIDTRPESKVLPSAIAQDLGVLARVPLASGFLSGKYKPGATFPPGDVRANPDQSAIDNKLKQVEAVAKALPPGVDMAQWALAWCLLHPAITAAIPGCKSVEQVHANASAADLPMVRDDHPQAVK
jgi:myo-inositol catabolism protein IolS